MPKVKTLIPHAKRVGIGIWAVGDEYYESPMAAQEKARSGFVQIVDSEQVVMETKEDKTLYRTEVVEQIAKLVGKKANWYVFDDGSKILGKSSAADYLGVSVEELEAMNVDLDND